MKSGCKNTEKPGREPQSGKEQNNNKKKNKDKFKESLETSTFWSPSHALTARSLWQLLLFLIPSRHQFCHLPSYPVISQRTNRACITLGPILTSQKVKAYSQIRDVLNVSLKKQRCHQSTILGFFPCFADTVRIGQTFLDERQLWLRKWRKEL